MKGIFRFWSYAVITVTCLASTLGIVNAGPVKAIPEGTTIKASDPVYLQLGNVYFSQQQNQDNIQQMRHYSHESHNSHYSHSSHASHYSSYRY